MRKLNLKTENRPQEMVKAYLEENASEIFAGKINHGVPIRKDGKVLINRKSLGGFMKYAAEEAKKRAKKGETSACVEDETVYGWAVHYFEEDEIEGTLYNEDGTPYIPAPAPLEKSISSPVYTPPAPKPKPQMSIFDDLMNAAKNENTLTMSETDDKETDTDEDEPADEEISEEEPEAGETDGGSEPQGSPLYQSYKKFAAKYPDALLFLRVGDFYEALGGHAEKIAGELGLTLTGRDCGLKERVPMCGVPYHAAEIYFSKLIKRGYKVAVSEDLNGFHFTGEAAERIDPDTGEILSPSQAQVQEPQAAQDDELLDFDPSAFDKEALCALDEIFGDEIILR